MEVIDRYQRQVCKQQTEQEASTQLDPTVDGHDVKVEDEHPTVDGNDPWDVGLEQSERSNIK